MIKIRHIVTAAALSVLVASPVSAHVTLNPKEGVVGFNTFSVTVPTEKDIPTTQVRLVVPKEAEISGIAPVAGWTHTEKTEAVQTPTGTPASSMGDEDEEASTNRITEITWSGGKIGPGEFFQFPISVRYQGEPGTLVWKIYQTYADGSVVAWDDADAKFPAATVSMLKESRLDAVESSVNKLNGSAPKTDGMTSMFTVAALLLSVAAIGISLKK